MLTRVAIKPKTVSISISVKPGKAKGNFLNEDAVCMAVILRRYGPKRVCAVHLGKVRNEPWA